ncbi:MAG: hypothetical protein WDM87_05225 [Terracidiphilus sp.]
MKSRISAGLCLASLLFLAGCKGFWDLPPSTPSNPTTPTTLSSGVFYVLDQTTKEVVGYSISSGTLSAISGGTQTLSAAPFSIAVAPNGGFLYVGTVSGIYLYTIGSGGALSIGNNGAAIASDIPASMVISGSWLVDAFNVSTTSVEINAIPIDAATGVYTGAGGAPPSQTFTVGNTPVVKQMVLSPDSANLFVALGTSGTIVVPFASGNANPLGATATTIPLANSSGSALSVAVDPSTTPRLFYIGETNAVTVSGAGSGGLRAFNYSSLGSATLTQATGSPMPSGGLSPNAILPVATGDYVYVANGTGDTAAGNIAWFPITASGTTYTVAVGKTVTSGIEPSGLTEDSTSNFVLAVSTGGSTNSGDPDLEAYTISSGALTAALTSATGTDPVGALAIAALP